MSEKIAESDQTNKQIFFRPTKFTSAYFFALSSRAWRIFLFSLPLDLLILLIDLNRPTSQAIYLFSIKLTMAAGAVCLVGLVRKLLLDFTLWFGEFQNKLASNKRIWPIFVLGLIAIGTFVEVTLRMGEISLISILIALAITIFAVKSFRKSIKETIAEQGRMAIDRTLWIESANRNIFLFTIAPIIAARILSIAGAFSAIASGAGSLGVCAYWLSALGALLLLEPEQDDFMFHCTRCSQLTSIALKRIGKCPRCSLETREIEPLTWKRIT